MRAMLMVGAALVAGCGGTLPIGGGDDASGAEASTDATTPIDAPVDASVSDADASCPFCSDPLNCGALGHDCLGGACVDSTCQPITLVTDASASAITIVGDTVYWIATFGPTSIESCAKSGCNDSPSTEVPTGYYMLGSLASDTTDLYWGTQTTVEESTIGGSTAALASAQNAVYVAVDSTNVYWTDDCMNCDVSACKKTGCTTPTKLASNLDTPTFLAVDATNVYWVQADAIWTAPIDGDGGAPTLMIAGHGFIGIQSPTVDATHLFWSGGYDYAIHQCDKTNCAATDMKLATDTKSPFYVYVDATDVYWTTPEKGTVSRCKIGGCNQTPTLLAKNQDYPSALVGDSTALFWAMPGLGGGLYELAK